MEWGRSWGGNLELEPLYYCAWQRAASEVEMLINSSTKAITDTSVLQVLPAG